MNVARSFTGWTVNVPFEEIDTLPLENALLVLLPRIKMIPRITRQRPPMIRIRFISTDRHRPCGFCIAALKFDEKILAVL